jgi:hypothetical protein
MEILNHLDYEDLAYLILYIDPTINKIYTKMKILNYNSKY